MQETCYMYLDLYCIILYSLYYYCTIQKVGVLTKRGPEGSLDVTVFSPYWMVNRTGLDLQYQPSDDSSVLFYHGTQSDTPILLAYKEVDSNKK